MRNTYQIRKYLAMTITVALCAGMLAGCAKSDKSAQDASAGTGNTGTNASGNVVAGAGSNSGSDTVSSEQKGQTVQPETQKQAGAPESSVQTGSSQNAQSVSGTTTQTQQTGAQTQQADTQPSQAGSAATQKTSEDSEDDDDLITGDQKDFTGTFEKSDGTEKVTITLVNDKKLTFVFRTSMINGSAKVTGTKALYLGDDDYTITFDVADDTLVVTVDGEDGQQSSMNGVYFRDLGDDETEDEEEDDFFDADETEEYYDDEDMTDMDDEDDME